MKFKYKTIIGILFIELVLVTVLILVASQKLTTITHHMAKDHSDATLKAMVSSSKEYLITQDQAKLQELSQSALDEGVIDYIVIHDEDKEVLVSMGNVPNPLPTLNGLKGQHYTILSPIADSGFELGHINIGVSFSNVNQYIDDFKKQLPIIAGIGVLLSALFSWILGSTLSNRLSLLRKITDNVSRLDNKGNNLVIDVDGNDEVSSVIESFNLMADRVKDQYNVINDNKLFYENIFNCSDDMLVIVDVKGHIIQANQKFLDFFNCGEAPVESALYYLKQESVVKVVVDCVAHNGIDVKLSGRDGVEQDFKITAIEVIDQAVNKNLGILIKCSNMTKLYELINETKVAKDIAMDAVKQKDIFLANMSHEIRTPMNGVVGMLNILKTTEVTPVQREYLKIADSSSKIMLTVIGDILDFSKIEAGKLELDVQPTFLYEEIMGIVSPHMISAEKKGIQLNVEYDKETLPFKIMVDSVRFSQIIHNLLSNAIKFTESGFVTLNLTFEKNEKLVMRISDTGIGMKQEAIDTLFQPFKQADSSITRNFGGTGLGTTIVKQLVTIMHGSIRVTSEVGKGSQFVVQLPVDISEKEVPNNYYADFDAHTIKESETEKTIAQYNLNVLLVEDNEINQMVAKNSLKVLGCKTDIANNGEKGLQYLQSRRYDLVLMDMQMPVMDGITAVKNWNKLISEADVNSYTNESVPIVAMTANASANDRNDCLNAGMVDFISKPFELSDLEKVIINWCEYEVSSVLETDTQINEKAEGSNELLDVDRFKKMSGQFGEQYNLILEQYINNSTGLLEKFYSDLKNSEYEVLHRTIHSLKGSSGTMGFTGVYEQSKAVEKNVIENKSQLNKVDLSLFDELKIVHAKSIEELSTLNLYNASNTNHRNVS